jgi:hypothetical protein
VTRPLGTSGLAVARQLATPEAYSDEDLVKQLARYSEKVEQLAYPGRDGDLEWLAQLKATAARRASIRAADASWPRRPAGSSAQPVGPLGIQTEPVTPYGWPESVVGDKHIHHHMGNGPLEVAIPQSLHRALSGEIHARSKTVAKP